MFEHKVRLSIQTMEKLSNATLFRQIALQNLQRKNFGFSETDSSGFYHHLPRLGGGKVHMPSIMASGIWDRITTLYNVCSVHQGMFSTSGGVQYIGGIP